LLIDKGHRRWVVATIVLVTAAIGLHAWFARRTPEPLTGGSTVGLWYGIIGSALMIYAGLLSVLRKVPSWWWIGARQVWLRGHIWFGLLSLVFILGHSNYHWGSGLSFILWLVALGVVGTGIFGLVLQQFLPQALATRVSVEAPFEQLPYLCRVLCRRADALVAATESLFQFQDQAHQTGSLAELNMEVTNFHDKVIRPFLAHPGVRSSPLKQSLRSEAVFAQLRSRCGVRAAADPIAAADADIAVIRERVNQPELKDLSLKTNKALDQIRTILTSDEIDGLPETASAAFGELGTAAQKGDLTRPVTDLRRLCQDQMIRRMEALCAERRQYRLQERIFRWLHGWLLIHVPLSMALLILGVTHAISALYY